MTPIMPKSEAAELIKAARIRKKLDWSDIAAEIDALLDSNAEEFVKSFVQTGGQ